MAAPGTMQAAYVEELGPAEKIRYGELPVPAIGPTDVLVVEAIAVNQVIIRAGVDELAATAVALNRQASGGLRTRIREVLPLARAADAHPMVEARIRGRMVLRP